ncbi:MAG: GNAT family N-acetyltransferase [Bdellovibrionota bacterium]|nr:GNAT family N-acetyltransferase [Bdellovibrionota bacterium]
MSDVKKCAEFVYLSSKELFDFVLGGLSRNPIEFLEQDFVGGKGFFGYKHLYTIKDKSEVVACLTIYQSKKAVFLTLFSFFSVCKVYSIAEVFSILRRCYTLKSIFITPSKDSLYMGNGYVDPAKRRPGYFSELVAYAEQLANSLNMSALECDINVDNETSLAVHRFLGFDVISEQKVDDPNVLVKNVKRMRCNLRGEDE